MRVLGTHLDLSDPKQFFEAWENLGDLSDDDCEREAAIQQKKTEQQS